MSKGFQLNWLISLIAITILGACQSQSKPLSMAEENQYLQKEGVFLMRHNPCHCLEDTTHGKSLEYEILLLSNELHGLQHINELKATLLKKEELLKRPWHTWGHWQRVYLAESIDPLLINELYQQLQNRNIAIVSGEIKNQYIEAFNHFFIILSDLIIFKY